MNALHKAKSPVILALGTVLFSVSLAVGCGTGDDTSTAGETGAGAIASTYEEILAARYDEMFPDDRVQTVRISMEDSDWEDMQRNPLAKEYYRADISIDGEVVQDVAVRTKGSSSLSQAARFTSFRAGLKVDFNFFNQARSFHGIKKLTYSNGFSDPTLMKEFLGYEIMAAAGIPTPRCCFVDLWVNDAHLGVYTQIEAVDAAFVSGHFDDGNGNLYKPEIVAGRLNWTEEDVVAQATEGTPANGRPAISTTTTTESFKVGGGDLEQIIERLGDDAGWIPGRLQTDGEDETTTTMRVGGRGAIPGQGIDLPGFRGATMDYLVSMGLKTNEDKADYSRLYELLEVLNSDPAEVSLEDLERVMDVDEVLRFLAASVVLVHLDNYIGMGHNYYLYDDGGTFSIIPWDLNMVFGGFDSGLSDEQIFRFYIDEPTSAAVDEYPLIVQLIDEPQCLDTYHGYLKDLIEGPFSVERMTARIDEIADLVRPYVREDTNVDLRQFERGLTSNVSGAPGVGGGMRVPGGIFIGLNRFVNERVASINAQLSGGQISSKGDGSGNGGVIGPGRVGGLPGGGPGGQVLPGGQGGDVAPGGQRAVPGGVEPGAEPLPTAPGGGG